MTKISLYAIDTNISANDKWIGSDANTNYSTKNFTPKNLADFYNESGLIGVASQVGFKYYETWVDERPVGSITTSTVSPDFSTLSTFKISDRSSGGKNILDIIGTFLGNIILLSDAKDQNNFAIYEMTAIEEDLAEPNFYDVSVTLLSSNGSFNHSDIYTLSFYSYKQPDGDKFFEFNQVASSSVWEVNHSLNKFPSVSVVDSGGTAVIGDVDYIDSNNLTITFSIPFSGKAYMN